MLTDKKINKNEIIKINLRLSAKICVLNKGYSSKLKAQGFKRLQAFWPPSFQASEHMN
jgi:hypothetical protein